MATLTPAQKTTLRNDIVAKSQPGQPLQAAVAAGDWDFAATFYNTVGATIVWRTAVTRPEIMTSPNFDWTRVDNLSPGKERIWNYLFDAGSANPSQPNIRAGIDAAWVGTAADLAVRATVYTFCKRACNAFEKLYAAGTGTDAVPATMAVEGVTSAQQLSDVYNQV